MRTTLVIAALALAMVFLVAPDAAQAAGPTNMVILATGTSFPDALAGGILSQAYAAPILLTGKDSIPSATAAEISRRVKPKVIILGGEGAVGPAVVSALSTLGVTDIERIGGKDRYETAALVAKRADAAFLETGMAGVLDLAPYVTVEPGTVGGLAGPHVIFTGANVHVRSGAGQTFNANGRGNLILGYNEMRASAETERTGSHTLVVGPGHNWTSWGGLVAGSRNTVSGSHSSVSGGYNNTASGSYSSVNGGFSNTASGLYSSVNGGFSNIALGERSSVSGGSNNAASGSYGSVSGGRLNAASGSYSSVNGGSNNAAVGSYSSVSGGLDRTVTGAYDWRAGGLFQDE
ncbi:MAG: cell wall-binding repeat-containing protein [Coriobacteriia bacterium]|nr:cell wall-binding repeat-containing protein [Coriobacteriia bacterium]